MRTIALGDLHLSTHTPSAVADDLSTLVKRSAGARLLFVGDFFDLSAESPRVASARAIEEGFAKYANVRRAFSEHVDRGGELRFVAGNHDPELGGEDSVKRIADALDLRGAARTRVVTTPWFFREGALHVEHGHLYDPDNAPAHPLVVPKGSLGVHFVEEFIAPTGAYAYLNKNDGTPLELFFSAFKMYGPRGPYVVARYFYAAARALAKSGPFFDGHGEIESGEARVGAFLQTTEGDRALVAQLLGLAATPTMSSLRGTVARLYLDRVSGTVAILSGIGLFATGKRSVGAGLVALGALALATSWSLGHDRYGGHVHARLADAAAALATATKAKLVVFGHAHVASDERTYANTGSFAFPKRAPGRPYLELEGGPQAPRAVRRWFTAEDAVAQGSTANP
ncbi:hypothetical protein BH09MYX1_BH09MYX1_18240 [soil metagenome]